MTTLAPKLPYSHPFAGGYPRLGGQPLPTDPDAIDYLERVAAADGAAVEVGVAMAVDAFVKGCKADGIWSAIKASCIMAGARTISGALVPLVGPAPTAEGAWVSSDYDRATGLKGVPASGTYLNTNRANDADGQDDRHLGVYITESQTINALFIACETSANVAGDSYLFASGAGTSTTAKLSQDGTPVSHYSGGRLTGMYSASRSSSSSVSIRRAGATVSQSVNSVPPISENMFVFNGGGGGFSSDARLAFYSIGSAISDLSLLDNRVSSLIAAIASALS